MTQGFKDAGACVIGAIEIDNYACKTYSLNHPEVHLWSQPIEQVTGTSILKTLGIRKGQLDLLGGCPPCQGFSTLRTYNGGRRNADPQNDLIFEFLRLVKALKPKRIMLENVPALLRSRRLMRFVKVLKSLKYVVEVKVLNVADYAVPQRRRRVVLLASRVSGVRFATQIKKHRTVRETISGMLAVGRSGDPLHDIRSKRAPHVKEIIRAIPRNGGSRRSLPKRLVLKCHQKSDGFKDVYGRMKWDEPSPTITTGCFNPSKGRFLHPEHDRAISMREAALLQSFPRSYKFPENIGKITAAKLIGNALPPEFIRRHTRQLLSELRTPDKRLRSC